MLLIIIVIIIIIIIIIIRTRVAASPDRSPYPPLSSLIPTSVAPSIRMDGGGFFVGCR